MWGKTAAVAVSRWNRGTGPMYQCAPSGFGASVRQEELHTPQGIPIRATSIQGAPQTTADNLCTVLINGQKVPARRLNPMA